MGTDQEGAVDALPDEVAFAAATEEAKKVDNPPSPEPPPAEEGDAGEQTQEGAEETPAPEGEAADAAAELGEEGDAETRSQRRRRQRREHLETLERDNAHLSNEVTRLKERLDKLEAPNADDYENPDEYTADLAAHRTRKANIEDQLSDAEAAGKRIEGDREAVRNDDFKEASEDARSRYSDYDKVALGNHWKPTPVMMDVILDSPRSADLAYYLGANVEEVERISRLTPVQQAAELGKIEATKLPDRAPKPKPQTKAPPPITPVRPTSVAAEKAPSEMSTEEYRAWRRRNEPKPPQAR